MNSQQFQHLAERFQTPLFVYNSTSLRTSAQAYLKNKNATLVTYALKANNNLHLLKMLQALGMGADITSGGELFLALEAGISPEKIIFSGVGKTIEELNMAIDAGIKAIHVESKMEWQSIAQLASTRQEVVPLGIRVNPNIFAKTHPYISTGQASSKFGVTPETAVSLFHKTAQHPYLTPVGIAAHIGSQITDLSANGATASYLVDFANKLAQDNIHLKYIDVGGGLGIDYTNSGLVPQIKEWVTAVSQPVHQAGFELVMEPGRSIIGPAGSLLTKVLYIKEKPGKQIVIVDAAMNDLLRPTLYQATHPVQLVHPSAEPPIKMDIVGPVCESGDWLAKDIWLPPVKAGDLLLIQQAGAYGFAMGSNYNGRLRPAEILIQNSTPHLIRKRQTYQDLLQGF